MTWTELKEEDIVNKPLVLAGPILRRTDPDSVTVWVALKEPKTVTLTIFNKDLAKQFSSAPTPTTQIGSHLHVVAVTAKATSTKLARGVIYQYDLKFGTESLDRVGILDKVKSGIKKITYTPWTLPTFVLPPLDLNKVRLIHGSCRKPHGQSLDAMESLHYMIESTADKPLERPHRLFLTGDQIYADDVADILLKLLTKAGKIIVSDEEKLPDINTDDLKKELEPGKRKRIANEMCKFSSEECVSHLFSFGEYCSMYLFAWSDVLWPSELPEYTDVFLDDGLGIGRQGEIWKIKKHFEEQKKLIINFRDSIPYIRKALANIPTYMIWDDHEITDDWNIKRNWVKDVFASKIGKRVILNGMLAYAIFQAWGNDPIQFETGYGLNLLDAATHWRGRDIDTVSEAAIARHLGIEKPFLDNNKRELYHDDEVLNWHYMINDEIYTVVVLDSRRWRTFNGDNDPPGLISEEGFKKQLAGIQLKPPFNLVLVVAPSPVIGVPIHDLVQKSVSFSNFVDPEAWAMEEPPTAFESLLSNLSLLPISSPSQSRVVILSGDVHYGFAAKLRYSAKKPFTSSTSTPEKRQMVVAQLTSSAFKNEDSKTKIFHRIGYGLYHSLPSYRWLGWKTLPSTNDIKILPENNRNIWYYFYQQPHYLHQTPVRLLHTGLDMDHTITAIEPDWQYSINYILALNEVRDSAPFTPIDVPSPSPGNRIIEMQRYLAMASNFQEYLKTSTGKEIVGLNNIGEITFLSNGNNLAVTQNLWWRLEKSTTSTTDLKPFPLTKYVVSLNIDEDSPIIQNSNTGTQLDLTVINEISTIQRLQESYANLMDWQIHKKNIFFGMFNGNISVDIKNKIIFIDEYYDSIDTALKWISNAVKYVYQQNNNLRLTAIKKKVEEVFLIPGLTDLEKMARVYEWSMWFWDYPQNSTNTFFPNLMHDMVLIFTNRSTNLMSTNDGSYIATIIANSTGFQKIFRDDSNQVQHATMAITAGTIYGVLALPYLQSRENPGSADRRLNRKCIDIAVKLITYPPKWKAVDIGAVIRAELGAHLSDETGPWTGPVDGDPGTD